MSAELLRKAATILRERAEACDPWQGSEDFGSWADEYASDGGNGTDAAYIRVMHPGVGLALANWLDDIAAGWVWDEHPDDVETPDGWPLTLDESMDRHALTLARLIVGDES